MTTIPTTEPRDDDPSLMRDACKRDLEQTLDSIFDHAELYDCRDAEEYAHTSPEEALEEFFDFHYEKGVNIRESIAMHCPITMTAHNREEVTPAWIRSVAEGLVERIGERFGEDYGDPDGRYWDDAEKIVAGSTADAEELVRKVIGGWDVWRCEEVATRVYSAEEVEKILREQCPEWFEEDGL